MTPAKALEGVAEFRAAVTLTEEGAADLIREASEGYYPDLKEARIFLRRAETNLVYHDRDCLLQARQYLLDAAGILAATAGLVAVLLEANENNDGGA